MPTPKQYDNNIERQRAYRQRQKEAREIERAAKGLPSAPAIPTMPAAPRWNALIITGKTSLEASRDAMQTYFDDRSEQWQESERGEELQARIEQLDSIIQQLEELE